MSAECSDCRAGQFAGTLVLIVINVTTVSAWPYSSSARCEFQFNEQGQVMPLLFNEQYKRIRGEDSEARNDQKEMHRKWKVRVDGLLAKQKLTLEEQYELHRGLLLIQPARLITLLTPHLREREPIYRHVMNLSLAHAQQSDWSIALSRCVEARDYPAPRSASPGVSTRQTEWLLRVDDAYFRYLRYRARLASEKREWTDWELPPIFDQPLRVENSSGEYDPVPSKQTNRLAVDALPIVQQLVLWLPGEYRLQWLLAELYAMDGKWAESKDVFENCMQNGFSTPSMKQHAAYVRERAQAIPMPVEQSLVVTEPAAPPPPAGLFDLVSQEKFYLVGGLFVFFASILIGLQIRSIRRRWNPTRS